MRKLVSGKFMVMFSVVLMIAGLTVSSGYAAKSPDTVSIVVKFVPGLTGGQQVAVVARNGGVKTSSILPLRLLIIAVPKVDLPRILPSYQADPWVERVEVAQTRKAEAAPSDANYGVQWSLPKIGWNSVYGTVTPTGTATVALLDTGIEASHPDLAGVIVPGTSILDNSKGLTDPNGHGTYLAGIIAAVTDNNSGIAGIAYQGVKIMPVSVLDADGTGDDSDIIAGIVWAADQGANIILMGFSNPNFSQNLQDAIDYAWSKGAVLVAATGNDGISTPTFPAGARGVIGVSDTDETDLLVAGSNYGLDTFLAAPGANIFTTGPGGSYTYITGTSASSAIVAGVAGFMKAADPTLANGVIVGRLAKSADAIGTAGDPNNQLFFGNGRVNMANALAETSTDEVQPVGVSGGGGPIVGPYMAAANAASGNGTMTVTATPATTYVYSTGNSLAFTFTNNTANNFQNNSVVDLAIPAGWSAPQTTVPTGAGYVSITSNTCAAAAFATPVANPVAINITCAAGTNFILTYANVAPPTTPGNIAFATRSKSGGGGTLTALSSSPSVTVASPLPAISSTSPSSVTAGASDTTLVVSGSNLVSGATVNWNGTPLATVFNSSSQLTATIPAASLAIGGTFNITAVNPSPVGPSGGNSNSVAFTVNNPVPTTTAINPNVKVIGDPSFSLTVNGTNFNASSIVQFNGSNRATTYVSPTQVTAVITASDLATAGNYNITVVNPAPGGGTSNAQTFTVNNLNPVPTTGTISPLSKSVGDAGFTLTVNGTNFVSTSVVQFNGSNRSTTYVNSTQLTAAIPATDLLVAGTFNVTVFNPSPGGGTSGAQTFTVNKATPSVTAWPTASAITYGQALSAATLTGGTASVAGSFTYDAPATVPGAGSYSAAVTFTPIDTNYNAVSGSINVTVNKATPNVTAWPTAGTITYGQTLAASTLSGGTATPAGSFAFTTPATAPNAGTAAQSVTYTPTDSTNYTTATSTVSVTVNKATPNVTAWPTAGTITYGQTLTASTLSGGAATPAGSFAFTTPATAPNAGTAAQGVTYTPTDSTNYTTATSTVSVTVNKATPNVTAWPTAGTISYGQTLTASTLSGGAATPAGSFAFTNPSTAPNAGIAAQGVTYTPTDSTNYTTATNTVSVTVNKATPNVTTWPTASAITYGQTLAASTLSGGAATPAGSFAFTTPSTAPNAGTAAQGVTYTPTDSSNYATATGTVSVTVNKATPNVTAWPTASAITYGQTLAASTLSGGAATPVGSFAFTTPSTAPNAGTAAQGVTYTPTDSTNYTTATGTVSVTVNKATPNVSAWPTASPITFGQALSAATLTGGTASVAGSFAYDAPATVPGAGSYSAAVTFTPTDTNYNPVSGTVSVAVAKATPTATLSVSNSPQAYTGSGQAANVNISASSVAGTVANVLTGGAASQTNSASYAVTADFVPADSTNYTTLTGLSAGNFVISKATPTATLSVSNSPQAYTGSGQAASVNISSSSVAGTVANVLTGGAASQTNAATYAVTANFVPADSSNYTTLTGLSAGNFVISKATPTATLSVSNSPQAYTGSGQAASVNISSSSVAGSVANVLTGGAASQTNAATYAVTADFVPADSTNYIPLTGLSAGNFVINPANQTINFGPLADKNLGDTVTLSASATSALAVTFASQTTGVCTTGGAYGSDVTLVATGTCTIRATQAGSANFSAAPSVDQSYNVNPGVLDHFAFSAISSPRTAGSPFGITITAQDAGNNTVTAFSGTVNLTGTAGAITPASTAAFVNGSWTGSVSVTGAGAGKAIIAADPVSGKTGTSGSFDVNPAAAVGFSVSAPPSVSAGSAISVTVTAKDTYNNVATGYLGTIHFTGTDNHSGIALPADYTFQPGDNGSHTFNGEVTLETAGPQTVTATDTTVPAIFGTSNSIAVSPAGAAKLLVTAPPTATAGTAVDVIVTVKDTYDNTITDYAGTVHFTSSDQNGTIALPVDYTFVGDDNGTHAFTAQTALKTSGTQTVTATDTVTALINGTSGSINVGHAAASKLTFEQQPVTTTPVQAITPAVTVRVEDQYGNLVANSTAPVAMAIGTNPGSGILSGTTPQNSVNGIATFNDLSIDVAASGYQLTATSSSLASATSNAFEIAVGALHHFVISSIGTQTALSGFSMTIIAQDALNNTVTSFTGSADLSVSGGSTISPAITGNFSNGLWADSVTVSGGGTGRVITATRTGGSENGASSSFDVVKATASVSLSNLTQTYTGSPLAPGVSTTPPGLTVDLTGAPQTNAGSYPVAATINDSNYQGNSSGTLTIGKAVPVVTNWPTAGTITYGQTLGSSILSGGSGTPAGSFSWTNPASVPHAGTIAQNVTFTPGDTDNYSIVTGTVNVTVNKATSPVTLSNLTTTYEGIPFTGIPQVPTATTVPAGLRIVWTNAPQSNAGSYAITATIDDTDYQGSASGTFTINKAAGRVTLANLSVAYDGTPKAVTASTDPFGLTVNVTYNGTGTAPVEPGSYAVSATINDANYQGNASGTLVIAKAAATVSLSNMTQNYTGNPLTPTATTNPPGLGITWTNAPQTGSGSYAVTATINDVHYQGSANGTFTINSSDLPACGAPASITAPAGNTTGSLSVSWSPSNISGVTYVLESSKDGGAYTTVYSGLSTAATITIAANGSYTFRVKAIKTGYADSASTASGTCVVTLTSGAPASITVPASNTTGSITTSWSLSNISGATYVLESSKDGGAYTAVYSGLSTAATITVTADGSYTFRVKAIKSGYADSAYTTSGTCVVALASGAPASITVPASNATGSITVSWSSSNISGATYVLESSKGGGAYTAVYSGLSTAATIIVTADGSYTFRVKATKAGYADSTYKTSGICLVTLTCGTPASITVPASNTTGSFSVMWGSGGISGVTYVLESSKDGGAYTTVYSGLSTAATVTVTADGSYTFRVKATKSGYADSAYKTSGICVVTLTCGAPASINVPASNTTGSFSVSWGSSNISGVTYVLQRSTDGVTWTAAYSGMSTAATVTVPAAGSYSFRVKATKAGYADSSYRISTGSCLVAM